LWPAVIAVGRAREPWQLERISPGAGRLLALVDKRSPLETDGASAKAATELEKMLLIYSEQFHREAGSHARRLESWDHWGRRTGFSLNGITGLDEAKRVLERVVEKLNRQFQARGRLPWQA